MKQINRLKQNKLYVDNVMNKTLKHSTVQTSPFFFSTLLSQLIKQGNNDDTIVIILYMQYLCHFYQHGLGDKTFLESIFETAKTNLFQEKQHGGSLSSGSLLRPEISSMFYKNWVEWQTSAFNDQLRRLQDVDVIRGGGGGDANMDTTAHTTILRDQLLYKLGVVYGSMIRFLQDIQTEPSGNKIDATGFVKDMNQLVPFSELIRYASSIVSIIDSALYMYQSNNDLNILKPILHMLGVNFRNVESTYQEALAIIQEMDTFFSSKKQQHVQYMQELDCKKKK